MIEVSGYPAVNEVVEAWVSVAWVSVYWTGAGWRYHSTGKPVPYAITHWKPLAGVMRT